MHDRSLSYIHPDARIADNVIIEPFVSIHSGVTIAEGTWIGSNAVIYDDVHIGKNCKIFPGAVVGAIPQDLKYQGEPTTLTVGDDNIFREGVTVHRGTVQDRGDTAIGNNNLLMAYAHVGHDCVIEDHCILVNNAVLGGHVNMGDWSIIGGYAGAHQYCNVGAHAYIGGMAKVTQDVPAYMIVEGHPAIPRMINVEGLKRRGFSAEDIKALQQAYKVLYRKKLPLAEALEQLREMASSCDAIHPLITSIESSTRGIVRA